MESLAQWPEASQQMIILYHHELFAGGIARLLSHRGFKPLSLDARSEGVYQRLQALQPRVIVVEDNDSDALVADRLTEILRLNPEVGVIRVNIQSNRLGVYSARQVTTTRLEDLFDAIDHLAASFGPSQQQPALEA